MKPDPKLIVLALGGNAISPANAEGNIPQQFAAARETAARIVDLIDAGYRPIVTHGNGPQVGNVLRRVELAAHEVYPLPLQTCVADTQGGMGYMIAESLNNELCRRKICMLACTIITTVEVAADDEAFNNPTKPIGGTYTAEKAAEMQARFGWTMVEIPGKGHRRTVASPRPTRIVELDLIREIAENGHLVVAAGGGGIPVARTAEGDLAGIEAVIDKDRTSALLAAELPADLLVIATETRQVALNYGQPDEQLLDSLTVDEANRHLADGQFPPGSMGPKIESAIDFIQNSRAASPQVVICGLDQLTEAVAGRAGTRIQGE